MVSPREWIITGLALAAGGVLLILLDGSGVGVIMIVGGGTAAVRGALFHGRGATSLTYRRFAGLVLLAVLALAIMGVGVFIVDLATGAHSSGRQTWYWVVMALGLSITLGLVQWGRR